MPYRSPVQSKNTQTYAVNQGLVMPGRIGRALGVGHRVGPMTAEQYERDAGRVLLNRSGNGPKTFPRSGQGQAGALGEVVSQQYGGGLFSIPSPPIVATPLPQQLPAHPGYQATGPMVTTLPQRAGMATQGPVQLGGVPNRPFGMTMPQPSGGGMLQNGRPRVFPGSGMGFYRDDEYNPTPQQRAIDDAGVARDQMYGAADPAGPYSGAAGMRHFGPLASYQPNTMQPPDPSWQQGHLDAADASQRRARGLTAAYVQTGPPIGGLSSEMETRRQAAIARQADREQMLAANRNVRANRLYGAPLRQDLFPRAEAAYAQTGPAGSVNASPGRSGAGYVASSAIRDESGNVTGTDWNTAARKFFDDPKFKSNPRAAWDELRKNNMSSADVQALIDQASGVGLFNLQDTDPAFIAWVQGLGQAAGIQGPVSATPSQGQANPARRPVAESPSFGNLWNVFGTQYGPPDQYAPPPTPPRRRPGPAFRPDF